jgi:hypothetical protein
MVGWSPQISQDARFFTLMVFDIVQVIQFDLWDELKRAIDKSGY